MAREDPFRIYTEVQRRTRSLRRASDYVFLGIVVVLLAGTAVGLMPELEISDELKVQVAAARADNDALARELERAIERKRLLDDEVEFMEQEFRNRTRRALKPGETLLLIPEEMIKAYEGAPPRR